MLIEFDSTKLMASCIKPLIKKIRFLILQLFHLTICKYVQCKKIVLILHLNMLTKKSRIREIMNFLRIVAPTPKSLSPVSCQLRQQPQAQTLPLLTPPLCTVGWDSRGYLACKDQRLTNYFVQFQPLSEENMLNLRQHYFHHLSKKKKMYQIVSSYDFCKLSQKNLTNSAVQTNLLSKIAFILGF